MKINRCSNKVFAKENRIKLKIKPLGEKKKRDTLYSLFSDEGAEVREELSDLLEIPLAILTKHRNYVNSEGKKRDCN